MNIRNRKVRVERTEVGERVSVDGDWTRPVSKKYYAGLKQRVGVIVGQLRCNDREKWIEWVMEIVDVYLRDHTVDPGEFSHTPRECDIIFLTIRGDIDRAIDRSLKAKSRAQTRRKSSAEQIPADGEKASVTGNVEQESVSHDSEVEEVCAALSERCGKKTDKRRGSEREPLATDIAKRLHLRVKQLPPHRSRGKCRKFKKSGYISISNKKLVQNHLQTSDFEQVET